MHMTQAIPALDRSNLGDQVYEQIGHALLNGKMRPNDKLTIRGLAAQFGVSTSPVRDAVKQLTFEQALEQRSPKDVRVPVMRHAAYLEVLEIRLHLEGLAAAQAAARATPQQLRALHKLLDRNDRAIARADYALATSGNQEFHLALSDIAAMPKLQSILRGLWLQMGPQVACYYDTQPPSLNVNHYAVLAAIEAQDAKAACAAIQADILSAKSAMIAQLEDQNRQHNTPKAST